MNKAFSNSTIHWTISQGLVQYPDAINAMNARVIAIHQGLADEYIWLLEHPPLYTAGTSAQPSELIVPRFPIFYAGRGGRYTYHGPGQRVGYVMLNLNNRGRDVRRYVHALEGWLIDALAMLGLSAWRAEGRIGLWTETGSGEAKIAAIGVRISKWITFHGFSVNIDPDLSHFSGIIPCGIRDYGVTSLAALGINTRLAEFDLALQTNFPKFLAQLETPASAVK